MTRAEHTSYHHKGKILSEKARNALYIANMNRVSEETKHKISIATAGANNPFYGKTHSNEVKAKISKYQKAIYVLWSVYKSNNSTKSYREFRVAIKAGDITFEMQPITVFTR